MKLLDADRPPVQVRTPEEVAARRRFWGWVLYGVLVLVAAAAGSLGGLLFVYNTDLPQVDDLEHYRPISNTELFDDQGRVIGSFALQRRVVAR